MHSILQDVIWSCKKGPEMKMKNTYFPVSSSEPWIFFFNKGKAICLVGVLTP